MNGRTPQEAFDKMTAVHREKAHLWKRLIPRQSQSASDKATIYQLKRAVGRSSYYCLSASPRCQDYCWVCGRNHSWPSAYAKAVCSMVSQSTHTSPEAGTSALLQGSFSHREKKQTNYAGCNGTITMIQNVRPGQNKGSALTRRSQIGMRHTLGRQGHAQSFGTSKFSHCPDGCTVLWLRHLSCSCTIWLSPLSLRLGRIVHEKFSPYIGRLE